jgi:hypothetical protein
LTARQARRVGVELGVLLVAGGVVWILRRGQVGACALAALGVLLVALAVARPAMLVPFASRWMRMASLFSRIMQPVVLTVLYLAVITPMALLRRTLGRSPIARDRGAPSYWRRREPSTPELARRSMERPY